MISQVCMNRSASSTSFVISILLDSCQQIVLLLIDCILSGMRTIVNPFNISLVSCLFQSLSFFPPGSIQDGRIFWGILKSINLLQLRYLNSDTFNCRGESIFCKLSTLTIIWSTCELHFISCSQQQSTIDISIGQRALWAVRHKRAS